MEMDWLLPNSRKNEVWREGRKLLDRSLRPGATMLYRQTMQEITRGFLAQLRATPREFRNHINLSVVVLPCIVPPLTVTGMQPSGKTCHVSYVWIRLERGGRHDSSTSSGW